MKAQHEGDGGESEHNLTASEMLGKPIGEESLRGPCRCYRHRRAVFSVTEGDPWKGVSEEYPLILPNGRVLSP